MGENLQDENFDEKILMKELCDFKFSHIKFYLSFSKKSVLFLPCTGINCP